MTATRATANATRKADSDRSDRAFDSVEEAFALLARKAGMPRLHERMTAATGVDLDASSFHLIRRLEELGPTRPSDLAPRMGLDLSTVSRQVTTLEAAGLVSRTPDPQDGRAWLVSLSERGAEVSERVCATRRDMFAEILADWPTEDVEGFATLLARFARAMASFAEPPSHPKEPRSHTKEHA